MHQEGYTHIRTIALGRPSIHSNSCMSRLRVASRCRHSMANRMDTAEHRDHHEHTKKRRRRPRSRSCPPRRRYRRLPPCLNHPCRCSSHTPRARRIRSSKPRSNHLDQGASCGQNNRVWDQRRDVLEPLVGSWRITPRGIPPVTSALSPSPRDHSVRSTMARKTCSSARRTPSPSKIPIARAIASIVDRPCSCASARSR